MPDKPHHEVLVFMKTVWLSLSFDAQGDRQRWRIYRRRYRKGKGEWWMGLIRKGYAFTEWTRDTPKRPDGTDLWVQDVPPNKPPNKFEIWYSCHNWDWVFDSNDWWYVGEGSWP